MGEEGKQWVYYGNKIRIRKSKRIVYGPLEDSSKNEDESKKRGGV